MIRYEILILSVPEITSGEAQKIQKSFEEIVNKNSGIVISFERWGKYRLSYSVRKNEYGIYFLIRFEVASEKLQKLLKDLRMLIAIKLNDVIMRYMLSKLDDATPLSYSRPESLEDNPGSGVDKILEGGRVLFSKNKKLENERTQDDNSPKEKDKIDIKESEFEIEKEQENDSKD